MNQGNWQQQLEDNKQAFVPRVHLEGAVHGCYPTTLSAARICQTAQRERGRCTYRSGDSAARRRLRRAQCALDGRREARRSLTLARRESNLAAAGIQSRVRLDAVLWLSAAQPERSTGHGLLRLRLLADKAQSVDGILKRRDGQGVPGPSSIANASGRE